MGSVRVPAIFLAVLAAVIALYVKLQVDFTHFRVAWIYPYALMWTGAREANLQAWLKYAPVNKNIVYTPMQIPQIDAKDYSHENMREATRNFRVPAVVRGFFNDTTAVRRWLDPDYLNSILGEFVIPVVRNGVVGTMQDDRQLVKFSEAFSNVRTQNYAKEYLFFPVKSRFTFNGSSEGSNERLQEVTNELCYRDLDLDRIRPGFGSQNHKNFLACQIIIGKSTPDVTNKSIGSDWHCAGGNNWFIQVAGKKYWEFVEPKYSPYLAPLKGGAANMWTGNKNMAAIQKHIPRWTVTLETGDLLYNPDWMWHKIINVGHGVSIGVPTREVNITLTAQNNFYFTSITTVNKLLALLFRDKTGLFLPGYPPPSMSTEADN